MNEFDQFVKHELKVKYYARYTDDFVIISRDSDYLKNLLPKLQAFLEERLLVSLHPNKVSIRRIKQGIDFLGYVVLPHHTILRAKTKKRMFKRLQERVMAYKRGDIDEFKLAASLRSYLGVLSHADAYELQQKLLNDFSFWLTG